MMRLLRTLPLLLTLAVPLCAAAEPSEEEKKRAEAVGKTSVTEQSLTIDGKTIRYRVTAGLSPLNDDKLKAKAQVFSTTYERLVDGPEEKDKDGKPIPAATMASKDPAARPITYAFNGGPGSSSVWLHMGALGPRRVKMGPDGERPATPGFGDNAESWLPFTDLVFIDPVSTGFSRAADGEDPHQFHGLDEDVRAVAEFIRLNLVRSQRWLSPKYLVGESYGTTRAAGLSGDLQGRLGINLTGIVLVSPVLNFQTISFDTGNDDAYWLFLPTYTATAFYHKKLGGTLGDNLEKTLAEARSFATGEYLTALAQGDALTQTQRDAVAAKVASLTGLSASFVKRSNLRVSMWAFAKELLREESDGTRSVGRYDARYKGIDRNGNGGSPEYDPSYAVVQGDFTSAFNAYVRSELRFESDMNYEILTGNVHPWNFGGARNRYPDVSETLRSAMSQNPSLRVWIASGYYDLATPFAAAEYTVNHLGLDASVRPNITQTYFGAGHMMYLRDADRVKLAREAAAFYAPGVKRP